MSCHERFAVVRVPFPFTDRQTRKRRPAVVLSPAAFQRDCGHLLLAMITSAQRSRWPLDWAIDDLQAAGLTQPCLVRFKIFTLDERLVLGSIGALSPTDRAGVAARLSTLLPSPG